MGGAQITEFLHFSRGIKVSDLVHIFGEFVGILSIPKLTGKHTITKYASSSSGGKTGAAREHFGDSK